MTSSDVDARSKPTGEKVQYMGSPVLTGCFISEEKYVGSGYDKTPVLFAQADSKWKFEKFLDDGITKKRPSKIGKDAFGGKTVFFQDMKLEDDVEVSDKDTKHANYINCQKPFSVDGANVKLISTSDPNGSIYFWDVSGL